MTEQEGWEIKPIWDEKGRKSVFPDKHVFCQIQLPNIFVKYSSPISFRFTTGCCLKEGGGGVGVGDVCFFLTMRCFNDAMFSNS